MADKRPHYKKGTGKNELPYGTVGEVNKQVDQAASDVSNLNATVATQQPDIHTLQVQLANHEITQEQYDRAIGQMQGQRLAAAGVQPSDVNPGGTTAGAYLRNDAGPGVQAGYENFQPGSEPEGVDLGGVAQAMAAEPVAGAGEEIFSGLGAQAGGSLQGQAAVKGPPQEVIRGLPALVRAAMDPDAPAQLHQLLTLLGYHIQANS